MSRIEAPLATQIADTIRPVQAAQVIQHQAQAAQLQDLRKAEQPPVSRPVGSDELRDTAQRVKQVVEAASGKKFAFGLKIDEDTKDTVVEFKDEDGKVVKQIPSEEMLKLAKRIHELVGLFVDEKA